MQESLANGGKHSVPTESESAYYCHREKYHDVRSGESKKRSDDASNYSVDNSSKDTTVVDFTVSSDRNRDEDIDDEQHDSTSKTGINIILYSP